MSNRTTTAHTWRLAVAAAGLLIAGAASAGEIHLPTGLPGVGLGYAQPLGSRFGLRADFVTLGSHESTQVESGVNYNTRLKASRLGFYGDWFVFSGSFRLTGGVSSNQYRLDLDVSGADGAFEVGGRTYSSAADGLNVKIEFPKVTPYLGIGWGHGLDSGLRLSTDIGASLGRTRLTAVGRGNVAQADIDSEAADLRDSVGKVRLLPQLSVSLGYRF